ncbi:hypothetical protein DFH08DRAFT_970411 [Mycena albidolilacea]|uniref:Endo-beta-1,6-galactanase-like domain-containing protein n=1 Tax=Mycena albidolilacea TaxID=1033008 RepID=A0AAD6ZG74_9AGAR|nr:hypothetical protein DFH08DRAFT_970411 [Mycena albidolilacea]
MSNNASCGGIFVSGTEEAYGTYVANIISYWRSTGLNIDLVAPMHEPDNSFGACTQEGMQVSATQRADVINGVFAALEKQGLSTTVGIVADEAATVSLAASELLAGFPAIAHHIYDFPSDNEYTSTAAAWWVRPLAQDAATRKDSTPQHQEKLLGK